MKKIILIALIAFLCSCSARKNAVSGSTPTTTKSESNKQADGSSYEKAIVVESIKEEYAYLGKHCIGCEFLGQKLVFKKKMPFDILSVKDGEGKLKEYYFDISKFYGKAFK